MSFNLTPYKSRPPPGQQGSTPFRSQSTNKFRSSLVPSSSRPSPGRSLNPSTKLSEVPASARDLFRTSSPRSQRTARFAPDLPAEATRQNASVRKFAPQKSVSSGMSNTTSTEPFKMRIPSPDPDLTGEAIAKKIPEDPNRKGSVYADEFLAHICPPDFDELQRRQFFCVLDLRRLKYAADEIFAKKDWKLNILNFAKEYEKSRGLIMLRYGLYEFKNVKPSSEVLKRWRAAHNLPDLSDDGSSDNQKRQGPLASGSTKRKADEDLAPKDNTLMNANQNKRRNIDNGMSNPFVSDPSPIKKSKRKVDDTDEPDENQPSKLQKSVKSSATSIFANILNKTQNNSTPQSKASSLFGGSKSAGPKATGFSGVASPFAAPSTKSLFGSAKPSNGGSSNSVFSSQQVGSTTPATSRNIFSYPDSPGSSSSDDENDAGEAENESEEQPSAVVSTGTSTPPVQNGASLFGTDNKSKASNVFGAPTTTTPQTSKGGLFGRVQLGSDGQPVRASFADEKKEAPATQQPVADAKPSSTPAKTPGDYTFNPATTPISFGQSTADTPKPTGATDVATGAKPSAFGTPQAGKPSIFGVGSQATSEPKPSQPSAAEVTKPKPAGAPTSIFGSQPKPSGTPTSIFGSQPKPAETASSIFGSQSKPVEAPTSSIFGSQPKPAEAATSIFGSQSKPSEAPSSVFGSQKAAPATTSIFGAPSSSTSSLGNKDQPKETAATSTTEKATSIFGNSATGSSTEAGTKSSSSAVNNKDSPSTTSGDTKPDIFDQSFIAKNAAQAKSIKSDAVANTAMPNLFSRKGNPLFGAADANGTSSTPAKSIFGDMGKQTPKEDSKPESAPVSGFQASASPAPTPVPAPAPAAPLFGAKGTSKPAASAPASTLFGAKKPDSPTKPAPSIFSSMSSTTSGPSFTFGSQPAPNTNGQPSVSFGANTASTPGISFGAASSQGKDNSPKKVDFQFGSSAPAGNSAFTFGQGSASSSFSFTAGGDKPVNNPFAASNSGSQSSAPVFGGSSTTTPTSSFTFASQAQPATPKATASSQGSNVFGSSANTNGGPSFSFTQATPSQNTPTTAASKPSAPVSIFSQLQAASNGLSSAVSPFPAPSSIGTTPANGSPEPQTPNEGGEEAPQSQISLTEGGPGEEDETVVHEVRAKAVKFVPVQKGEEDEDQKSPWRTQGVGPLRILKNKTTGSVRVLLRAEPRGHIALNKALLPDVEYKAKEKTVSFAAAKDDGSGLETWVLQVKKPEFARDLAAAMESNKSANIK